jgi:hypothetical protein
VWRERPPWGIAGPCIKNAASSDALEILTASSKQSISCEGSSSILGDSWLPSGGRAGSGPRRLVSLFATQDAQNEDDCGRGIGHCDWSSEFVDLAAPTHHRHYGGRVF